MISKIWNWIKNKFKSEKQDPHIVLYEEVEEIFNRNIESYTAQGIDFRKALEVAQNPAVGLDDLVKQRSLMDSIPEIPEIAPALMKHMDPQFQNHRHFFRAIQLPLRDSPCEEKGGFSESERHR